MSALMLLIIGRIGRPHGIRGEVTVEVRTDEPEARFAPGSVLRTDPGAASGRGDSRPDGGPVASSAGELFQTPETLTVASTRWHQDRLLVRFVDIPDRTVAEELRDVLLFVDSEEVATPDDPDEFHDHQLVGLTVVDPHGTELGKIDRIDHAPASDLLVLRRPEGRTALIPFVKAIVPEVDLSTGRVVADAPPGLLDL